MVLAYSNLTYSEPPNASAQPRASSHVGCSALFGRDRQGTLNVSHFD